MFFFFKCHFIPVLQHDVLALAQGMLAWHPPHGPTFASHLEGQLNPLHAVWNYLLPYRHFLSPVQLAQHYTQVSLCFTSVSS